MPPPPAAAEPFWMRHAVQAAFVALLAALLYANTLGHDYAFDDGVVIKNNTHVQQGWSGIPAIMTRDLFDAYFRQMGAGDPQLSGGRYRPLSIVTFAIEQAVVGDSARVRHAINVLLYAAIAAVLLTLLRRELLSGDVSWALLATLIFIVHPIHTEAVANIKGRDELLSFLFIALTLLFALRYDTGRRRRDLALALAAYLLALLSKEYGIVLLALLPIALYTVHRRGALEAVRGTLPYVAVALVYIALRLNAIGFHIVVSKEILSNPYLYATADQALATKLALLLRYLALLVFPYPLSSDYSYRQIPYVDFKSALPWLSLLFHAGLTAWGVLLLRRRDVRAFAVFFYLATLAIVSNLVINIGAFMGDRLVFHASLGFALLVAWAALAVPRRLAAVAPRAARPAGLAMALAGLAAGIAAGGWTIERNRHWKNDHTLFPHDVLVAPESAVLNGNASLRYIEEAELPQNKDRREALLKTALVHLDKAIEIHPTFVSARVNRGLALFRLDRLDEAEHEWMHARKLSATDPMVQRNLRALAGAYFNKGLDEGVERRFEPALVWFEKALVFDPDNPAIWTNIGKSRFWLNQRDGAREAWLRALQLQPGRADAVAGLNALDAKPQ